MPELQGGQAALPAHVTRAHHLSEIPVRVKVARGGVVDHAVRDPVDRVTLLEDSLRDPLDHKRAVRESVPIRIE